MNTSKQKQLSNSELLLNFFKGKGYEIEPLANELGFKTRSGLYYQLNKEPLDKNFISALNEFFKVNIEEQVLSKKRLPIPKDALTFPEFIKAYRDGVGKRLHATITTKAVADLLNAAIQGDTVFKWEMRGTIPREKKHVEAIKAFFGIDDLLYISPNILKEAIEAYPNKRGMPQKKSGLVSNAFPLGPIDDDATEKTKSGNEFIDLGAGNYSMIVTLVPEYAYGGYLNGFKDPEYIESLPKHSFTVTEKHRGQYRAFKMRGDSMDNGLADAIQAGDTVVGRLINKDYWKSKLHIHKFKEFIIVHKNGIVVKEITDHDIEKGIIKIHSKNPDKEEYPDDDIRLSEVNELYNVVEVSKSRK